jgi:hypothetical protein
MTRTLLLSMKAGDVMAGCLRENVGVSAIEQLVSGGVRLVCMSSNGAARMRIVLKEKLIQGEVVRAVSSQRCSSLSVEHSPQAANPGQIVVLLLTERWAAIVI